MEAPEYQLQLGGTRYHLLHRGPGYQLLRGGTKNQSATEDQNIWLLHGMIRIPGIYRTRIPGCYREGPEYWAATGRNQNTRLLYGGTRIPDGFRGT